MSKCCTTLIWLELLVAVVLSTLSAQGAAFDVTVTPSATQVTVGSDLSYTIVVQNTSTIPLGNPVVTASFGTGANFVSRNFSNTGSLANASRTANLSRNLSTNSNINRNY